MHIYCTTIDTKVQLLSVKNGSHKDNLYKQIKRKSKAHFLFLKPRRSLYRLRLKSPELIGKPLFYLLVENRLTTFIGTKYLDSRCIYQAKSLPLLQTLPLRPNYDGKVHYGSYEQQKNN